MTAREHERDRYRQMDAFDMFKDMDGPPGEGRRGRENV